MRLSNSISQEQAFEIPSFLKCSLCSELLQDPVMHTSCQLLFCLKCAPYDQTCSFCHCPFSVESLCKPPKFVVESLQQVMVPCVRCHSMMPRHELDVHMETCPIPCHLGCGAKISPLQQHQHEKELCPMAIVSCSDENHWCDWKGKREQLNTHVQTCPFVGNKEFVSKIQEKLDMLDKKIQKLEELEDRMNDRTVHAFCKGMKTLESYTFRGKKFVSDSSQFVTRNCVFIECELVGPWMFNGCTFENCKLLGSETVKLSKEQMQFENCTFSGEGNTFSGVFIRKWNKNVFESQNVLFSHCALLVEQFQTNLEYLARIENSIIISSQTRLKEIYNSSTTVGFSHFNNHSSFNCTLPKNGLSITLRNSSKVKTYSLEHSFTDGAMLALNKSQASFGVLYKFFLTGQSNGAYCVKKFGKGSMTVEEARPGCLSSNDALFFAEIGSAGSEQEILDACSNVARALGYCF
ncbi:hypothetical protein C9374_002904 [Naegleria lovaniensis]|uniref:TRAF-type domain-containing protein n=1 Tax=Naegleria lovaniensis TaxID=51637 RepID=A0AA88GRY2_NAELO|nr:uncharacterized protein C9374_002904 [Naegleria lovaniensis]KAG2385755.1 hypothetical protein C9374_002904 [Naegleria lovaniensis]